MLLWELGVTEVLADPQPLALLCNRMLFNLSSVSKKISVFFERKLVEDVFIACMEEQDDAPVRNRCH